MTVINGQFDFDSVPAARWTDPQTSHEAAVRIAPRRKGDCDIARAALVAAGPMGLTDFELEARTGIKQTSIGKRRKDLLDAGEVEMVMDVSTGRPVKRETPTGSLSTVWRIKDGRPV